MMLYNNYEIILRLSNALSKVNASIYSISAPIGIPEAILVTSTSNPDNTFLMYKAVISPSIHGFTAIITSLKSSLVILSINLSNFKSSGFIPSKVDIKPFKTW